MIWKRISVPGRTAALVAAVLLHLFLVRQGWESGRLPGNEYRQTHTAVTALFVQQARDFSLDYPTPLLGKPWSIPYEFPLYQWTVVAVSDATGWPLIQCGRLVTLLCFYVSLPALAWLVRRYTGSVVAGWLVTLFALTCPLYIFYARSFLIDVMALMFSVWYARALVALLDGGSWRWAAVANLAGLGAGLVKVMTLMLFSIPLGLFLVGLIVRRMREQGGGGALDPIRRWAATAVVPIVCSYGWILFADAVKAENPNGVFFLSDVMHAYHFGNWADRLNPEIWQGQARGVVRNVAAWPLVGATVLAALGLAGRGRWKMLAGLVLFASGPLIFPILYAWHEYYFIAVGFFFLAAMAVGVSEVMSQTRRRGLSAGLILVVIAAQLAAYQRELHPEQTLMAAADSGMSAWIRASTDPDDILIIGGDDWSPMVPFWSQRRALMFRRHLEHDQDLVDRSLDQLAGERLGAFILRGDPENFTRLREAVAARFPLQPLAVATAEGYTVWADAARRTRMLATARKEPFAGVEFSLDAAREFLDLGPNHQMLAELPEGLRTGLSDQFDYPVSVMSQFPSGVVEVFGGVGIGAHPRMSFWLAPPAGRRLVVLEYGMVDAAHEAGDFEPTDGVGFSLWVEKSTPGTKQMLWRRIVDPVSNPADRGLLRQEVWADLSEGDRLIVVTDPGYAEDLNRDWAVIHQVRVR